MEIADDMEIVLIEDNEDDAERILRFLRRNYSNPVRHIIDGADAVKFLLLESDSRKKLILLDLVLPSVDGLEIFHMIKAEPEERCLQVVLLVSSLKAKDILQAQGICPDGYMIKPKGNDVPLMF